MATQSTTTLLAALTKRTSDLATLISQLQSRVDTLDPENSLRLILSDGVYNNTFNLTTSGMSLTISATGTYTAGNYSEAIVDGRYIKVDDVENFYTLENGDADYDRIDIVYVGRFGVGVVQGTPSATPTDPDLPEDTMALYKITVPAGETDGSGLTIEDVRVALYTIGDLADDLDDKIDKVSGAIADNFASLDVTGNIQDSGKSASDFLQLDQTTVQTIENGIPLLNQNISDYDSAKQITTKEYVDSALSIVSPFRFYLSNDDDTTGYKKAYLNSPVATETTMSFTSISGRQFLVGFITDTLDGLTQINAGVFNLLIDAQQTNMAAKDLYLDYELYGYDGSTETLLFSSDTSNGIPDTRASISIPATVLNTIDLSSYTNLIVKVYGNVSSGNIDLDLFVGGNNSIYFAIAGDIYDTQFARKDLSNVTGSLDLPFMETPILVGGQDYMSRTFYIDETNGDDNNDGSSGSPLKTLNKAINLIPRGGFADIYLQSDINFTAFYGGIFNKNIQLWLQGHNLNIQTNGKSKISGIIVRNGSFYILGQGKFILPSRDSDTTDINNHPAFVIGGNTGDVFGTLILSNNLEVVINDTAYYLVETKRKRTFSFIVGNATLTDNTGTGLSWGDLIEGVVRDANGVPRNILSNIII